MSEHEQLRNYETDSEALRWARLKVWHEIDRLEDWERRDKQNGEDARAGQWRMMANFLRRQFIGGKGCCIAAFDERRPDMPRAMAPLRAVR